MTVRTVSNNPASPFYNASAPTLTGQVGKLTDLLDAILVNGFSGFTNLGWTIGFTATNKRAYLQNLTGSNSVAGMYLYVDDNGPGAGAAKEARACGFETMSAITPVGTGQFPTGAQSAIGSGQLVIRKSTTADATARFYTISGDGQTVHIFIETGDSTAPLAVTTFSFGDFVSRKPVDPYAVMIMGRQGENSGSAANDPLHATQWVNAGVALVPTMSTTMFGHYVARSWTGIGGSVRVGKPTPHSMQFSTCSNNTFGAYGGEAATSVATFGNMNLCMGRNSGTAQWPAPNGPDGALGLSPVFIGHHFSLRGYMKGLYQPLHDRPCGHNDAFTVTGGNLNGKSFLAQSIQAFIGSSANAESGQVLLETSNTWPA